MKKEEAIKVLQENLEILKEYNIANSGVLRQLRQALEMAIQALEKENIYDDKEHYVTISKALYDKLNIDYEALSQDSNRDIKEISEIMKCDADAETKCKMISNILNAKPHYFEEQEPCDKCVMKNSNSNYCENCTVAEYHGEKVGVPTKFVEQQPPVMQKSGKWLITHLSNIAYCSECDYLFKDIPASIVEHFKYCPNCGKRIVEPQESEE